jgi:hypothetical protein
MWRNEWFLCYLTTLFQLRKLYNVEWDGMMIMNCEKKNLEGRSLFQGRRYVDICLERLIEQPKTSFRIADNAAEIGTKYLPNTSLESYRNENLLGPNCMNVSEFLPHRHLCIPSEKLSFNGACASNRNRGSLVSFMSDCGLDVGIRSPGGANDFSSGLCVQTGSGSRGQSAARA